MATFTGEEDVVFDELLSSGGMPIWAKGDPVHLTQTAYGYVAAALMGKSPALEGPPGRQQQENGLRASSPGCWHPARPNQLPDGSWAIVWPLHAAEEGQVVASVLAVAAGGDHPAGELPEETGGTPTRERPDGQKAKVIYSFNKLNSFFVYIKSYK